MYALHDALVKPMPRGLNTPSLAESWSMSKDGRIWRFVLRKGPRFHNGDPVTGPRVEEPGLTLLPAFPYSGPLEDVRLKK